MNASSSFIHDCQKVNSKVNQLTLTLTGTWIKKEMVHPYTSLLLSNKKKQNTDRPNIAESTYNNTVILNENKNRHKKLHII